MAIRWNGSSRDESVGMAVLQLLMVGGITDVSMRAIARTARMALGSLGNYYGSKEQVLMGAARAIGDLHVDDLTSRAAWDGSLAETLASHTPRDAEELLELKIWQDMVTIGRSSRGVGEVVAFAESRYRERLGRILQRYEGPDWAERHLDGVWLVLSGIRTELVRPGTTLDLPAAAALASRSADAAVALGRTVRS